MALKNTATYAGLACFAMLGGLAEGAHALLSKKPESSRTNAIGELDAEGCAR